MANRCRIDPHAHLYDSFSTREWCQAAVRNLGGTAEVPAIVITVDRAGQDSLSRLRGDAPAFADVSNIWESKACSVSLDGCELIVIQGTQYVTSERIEVLSLGAQRAVPDGMTASEYVAIITEQGGLACLPWSPGKWLGSRGQVVRRLLDVTPPTILTVGDISIRSRLGPPSALLRYARGKGFAVLAGTDPLPRVEDERLVGSFGLEVALEDESVASWENLKRALISPGSMRSWGERNSLPVAARRFLSSISA